MMRTNTRSLTTYRKGRSPQCASNHPVEWRIRAAGAVHLHHLLLLAFRAQHFVPIYRQGTECDRLLHARQMDPVGGMNLNT